MTRIYISRESTLMGTTGLLYCYVNDTLVAKIKNGEDATYDIDADVVDFRCHVPMGSLSDVYTLRLTGQKMLAISVKVGALKPQITVLDRSCIFHVETVDGQDNSRKVTRNGVTTILTPDDPRFKPFNPTKTVSSYFAMDDNSEQWAIAKGLFPSYKNCTPYDYADIVDFELLEDGSSISRGGLGRALVGGALFGGVGAIVGGVTGKKKNKLTCTSLMIKITVNDTARPVEYIKFITSSTYKTGLVYKSAYKNAQEIMSLLQLIANKVCEKKAAAQNPPVVVMQSVSAVDEIRKLKELLDDGIISQDEFEAKKKQLLGI